VLLEGFEEDITERVRAEQRLSDEKRLSETIINSIPGLFYMINQQGKMIWWNDYRDSVFEYTVDEQGYSDVLAYVLEADRPLAAAAMAQAFSGKQASVELRLPHKDGKVRDYYCTGAQVDVGGEPRIVGVAVDITEHKRAEEEKRSFYRETIKSVTQGKLDLVPREEVQGFLDATEYATEIAHPADVAATRTALEFFYESKGLRGETLKLFLSGVGEAMTNAIKHAGGGRVYAGAGADCAWSAVLDAGPGIGALTLPSATLRKGSSTKLSLGMGYSIMLASSDRISLSTGPDGTTVVLIREIVQPEPELSLDDLHDTWDELPIP
jgi:PAS domain S-box-containing protein